MKPTTKTTTEGLIQLEGTRTLASFNQSWEVIKELADEAIIFDFEMTDSFKQLAYDDLLVINSIRQQAILKKVAGMESEFEKIEYPCRRYNMKHEQGT